MSVLAKIQLVSKTIGHLSKDGENAHHKYRYQSWDAMVPALRNALADHKLSLIPQIVESTRIGDLALIKMMFTITDIDTGESISIEWHGEGKDTQDKALQKAATSAYKYMALKVFLLPTEGDDTDSDGAAPAKPTKQNDTPPPPPDDAYTAGVKRSVELGMDEDELQAFQSLCKQLGFRWFVQIVKYPGSTKDKLNEFVTTKHQELKEQTS